MLCVILVAKFGKRKRNEAHGTAKIESEYSVKTAAAEITVPATHIGFAEGLRAWAPFMLIFVLLILTSKLCPPVYNAIKDFKHSFMIYMGEGGKPLTFSWINTPGVVIFIAAICGGLIQNASWVEMAGVLGFTLKKYWRTFVTICSVLATAKVMIYSGMISDIARSAVVATGPVYPFVAPLIGVLGAFIIGSGTSTNVLFGNLQLETALSLNLNPYWITAANVMGAGIGKMVCPQNIAIGAGAIGITGSDSKILAAVFKYFVVYALLAGAICFTGSLLM